MVKHKAVKTGVTDFIRSHPNLSAVDLVKEGHKAGYPKLTNSYVHAVRNQDKERARKARVPVLEVKRNTFEYPKTMPKLSNRATEIEHDARKLANEVIALVTSFDQKKVKMLLSTAGEIGVDRTIRILLAIEY